MNGILKTQAQYYNDPVTYTGEGGTETNKAVIEDIFDLCAWHNVTTTQAETYAVTSHKQYAVMVADVNFNNHPDYKFGIADDYVLNMNFGGQLGELDGAGHTILNMVFNSNTPAVNQTGVIGKGTIKNTNFKNMVAIFGNRNQNCPIMKNLTLKGCNLSIYLSVPYLTRFTDTNVSAYDCTYNFTGTISDRALLNITNAVRTRFHFSNLKVINTAGNILIYSGTYSQCAFTGLIIHTDYTSVTKLSNVNTVTDCYFAIMTGITTYSMLFYNAAGPTTGMNMIDIDVLGGEYADGAHYMCVHTSDLKNKDFLQRYGFITL